MNTKLKNIISFISSPFHKAIKSTLFLVKVMIPTVIIIKLIQELGLIKIISAPFAPIMHLLMLPNEYALVWISAMLNTNYVTFSVVASLFSYSPISYAQVTTIAIISLMCHNLVVESIIAKYSGVNPFYILILRFISALIVGFIFSHFAHYLNIWQDVVNNHTLSIHNESLVSLTLLDYIKGNPNIQFLPWLINMFFWILKIFRTIFIIFFVIFALLNLVKALETYNIIVKVKNIFIPLARILKISKSNIVITAIVFFMGLSYSWGVIQDTKKNNKFFIKQQSFIIISMVSMLHAVVEEGFLFYILGAKIIVGMLFIFAYILTYIIIMNKYVLPNISMKNKYKYLYSKI